VIQAHYHRTAEKTYSLTNQTDHARIVYVEHSKRDHWKLSDDTPEPDEETESFYRFRVEVEPRETAELRVVEHQVLMDSYTVSNIRTQDVEMFVSNHYIDQAMRAALDNIIAIREKIGGLDNRLAASSREAAEIATDQARLRENIKALKDTVEARQLIARYVAKADEQETRIEQITDERKKMNEERARFQSEMDSAIRALSFDRKLKD
jgi:archaellum component FlaC